MGLRAATSSWVRWWSWWPRSVGISQDPSATLGDAVGGFVVLSLAEVLGLTVRLATGAQHRARHDVRVREREQLARELHDTVAHHVSAIVVRAQAGRVVAATRPEAAAEALEVIEGEAIRTLAELRTLVAALREDADAELTPQQGLADLGRLAAATGGAPAVEVTVAGAFDDLRPVGRGRRLPDRPGVDHQRRAARTARHQGRGPRRRRG